MKSTMKTALILLIFFTLLFSLLSLQAQVIPGRPIVRLIYFVPSGTNKDEDYEGRIRKLAEKTQSLYEQEMRRHKFFDATGKKGKTFLLERDAEDEIVVHQIDGKFTAPSYQGDPDLIEKQLFFNLFPDANPPLNPPFGAAKEDIYLIFVETDESLKSGDGYTCGLGIALHHDSGPPPYILKNPSGLFGIATVAFNDKCIRDNTLNFDKYDTVIQHELGHAFGLRHDYRNNEYIMSYGSKFVTSDPELRDYGTKLSDRAAEWLNHHRAFNEVQGHLNSNTTFMKDANKPGQISVKDIDGLGSVQVIKPVVVAHGNDVSLIDGISFNIANKGIVFDPTTFSTRIHGNNITINLNEKIILQAIDRHGNITRLQYVALNDLPGLNLGLLIPKVALTEVNLDGGKVSLELDGGTYTTDLSKIIQGVTVDGIKGVTINPDNVVRNSDNKITVELDFDGTDFDTNGILTFRFAEGVVTNYTGDELTVEIPVTARKETLSATTASPLTEVTLNENLVTLTLTDAAFEESIFKIQQAVTVDGIKDVTINPNNITRISDNEITVKLDFDGTDFDTNAALTFSVAADAIVNYSGDKLSVKKSVTARKETLATDTVSPLTEATLNENVVTLILTGATYEADISKITDAVKVSGIEGVSLDSTKIQRLSDRRITVVLNFDGTDLYRDDPLTFSVDAGAITSYKGAALTAEVPVTASRDESLPKIFWADPDTGKIYRTNYDGSHVEGIINPSRGPVDIALDVEGGMIYWTVYNGRESKIQCANLDGSNIEDLVTYRNYGRPHGIALDVEGGKMYWADNFTHIIWRANLDGSNIEVLVTFTEGVDGSFGPRGIALDVENGKMYWTNDSGSYSSKRPQKIQRANLDGSNIEVLVTGRLGVSSYDIALDIAGGKMYWTDDHRDIILRANLDGSDIEPLVTRTKGFNGPRGIALDIAGGKMYWTMDNGFGDEKIQRANLDGSNIEDLVTQGLRNPVGIAIAILSPVNPVIVKEDVNRDGRVDIHDLVSVSLQYGKTGTDIAADVNGDEVVNVDDFIVAAAAVDAATAAPAARAQVQSHFTAVQLQQWLTEARASGNTSHTYQKGIAVLEQLLAALTPKETALLANYPNPFNPETWIPYQLAIPADVTLTIYDINGHVVRDLDLGHQRAGMYQSRARAAHWDGKNVQGEAVASGVYFYTLKAGDFTATRKMLIRK